ncbi:hypothetical protein MYXO_02050 [Myxococcaceae bacterium]|jgi:hypothetical protein|nr:hypothetical protein MYXO_02050 [Myxococcaceae bacterium]
MRTAAAFVAAIATATVLGTAASTHFVLEGLVEAGAEIPLADRIGAVGQDLVGLGPTYALVVTPALAVFLLVGARLLRSVPFPPLLVFPTAGALALLVTMAALPVAFGVMPISGARSGDGVAAQMVGGIVAGAVFALVRGGSLAIAGSPRASGRI